MGTTIVQGREALLTLAAKRLLRLALFVSIAASIPGTAVAGSAPSVSINDVSVREGDKVLKKVSMNFTVSLSEKADGRISVRVATSNGTASAGSDYDSISRVVRFTRGQIRQTVTIKINGDTVSEPDETFFVDLSNPDGATLGKRRGVGTILDDDTPDPDVSLSVADASVTEGNGESKKLRFNVSAQPAPKSTVTVNYASANGTAKSGSDYVASSGKLTFAPGVTSQAVEVSVVGDRISENDETMSLTLSAPTGRGKIARGSAIGTIIDDDQPTQDLTPDPIVFTPLSHVEPGSVQVSEAVQILGLGASAPISIAGGTYSVNGSPFTSTTGAVANGDIVELRATASDAYGATAGARLTVGTLSTDFVLESRLRDTTPEPFSFEPAFSATPGSSTASAAITVAGIDSGTRISVTGGAYQIGTGPWTTTPGTVASGARVRVAVTASANSVAVAELRIGLRSARFSVTTANGTAAPRAFALGSTQSFPLLLGVSDAVTLSGLATPARIGIRGGQYSLNDGPFTDVAGVGMNGDRLRVAIAAAPAIDDRLEATIAVGAFTTKFSVTTSAPEDRTPDSLQLPLTKAEAINSQVITPPLIVKGVNVPVPITVTTGLSYSLNGGAFVSAPGIVHWGDALRLRVITGPEYARSYSADVTVGSTTTNWLVRTQGTPTRPARFTLLPASIYSGGLVLPGTVQTTEPITVTNADGAQVVSVIGGQYRINDGPYRATSGTVYEGDQVTLRTVMPSTFSSDQTLTLKIGQVSSSLTLTTTVDAVANTPPMPSGTDATYVIRSDGVIPLRAYVFQPPGWRSSDRRAAYIDWSGGGWARGGLPSTRPRYWAEEQGMVAIAPDQRVNDRFGTYAYVHAEDARLVLKWAQDNAGQLGIDPSRIVVMGSSSGGGNAVWASLLEPPATTAIGSSPSVRAGAVVLWSGVSSTLPEAALGRSQLARFGRFVDAISPDRDIDDQISPFLIFHADADTVFAETANLNLCTSIQIYGQRCEFHNQPGLGHDWVNSPGKFDEARGIEVEFLNRIGILPAVR